MSLPLFERQLDFVTALRDAGLTVSVAESLDAVAAMSAIDLLDREQLRSALATTLVKRQLQRPAFDAVFDVFYPSVVGESAAAPRDTPVPARSSDAAPRGPLDDPVRDRLRADLAEYLRTGDERLRDAIARDAVSAFGAVAGQAPGTSSWSALTTLSRMSPQTLMAQVLAQVLQGSDSSDTAGLAERQARTGIDARIAQFAARVDADVRRRLAEQSDAETVSRRTRRPTLEHVDFLGASRTDLTNLRREIQPLARRLATRLALDRRRGSRGQLDFRRTIRESLSTGGVPVVTHHRPRRPLKHDLVVVCDLSESVSAFAHFTLLLVFALHEVFGKVRAFGFVDEVDELTRFFAPGVDVLDAVTRLTSEADVTAMFGRTDYGRAFELIDERFPDLVSTRTSLLVLGDARSNYGELALPVLRELAGRARHAYWLNPERAGIWNTGDSRAAEYGAVVSMRECRNLAQLTEFVRDLAG